MHKTRFVSVFFFSILMLAGINRGQQKSQLKETTNSRYKVGQVWRYWTRPREKTSSFVVVKVDKHPTLGNIIHISLSGLRIRKSNGDIIETLSHMPFTETAIDSSGPKLLAEKADLPAYEEGYRQWKEMFDAGRSAVYARNVAETVEELEASLYHEKIPDKSKEDYKVLSKDKPTMFQEYNRLTNRTDVTVFLNQMHPVMFGDAFIIRNTGAELPVQSGLSMNMAHYDYIGRTPTRASLARFTFVTTKKDTFKDPPPFTINVEGMSIYEGEAELSLNIYEVNSQEKANQMVTLKVPVDIFLRVAATEKAEFIIGTKSYKPESFQYKYMRSLAQIIAQQGK